MLDVERVLPSGALVRTNHHHGPAGRESVTQLIPDVGVVGSDVGQTYTRGRDPRFYRVNWNLNVRVLINALWFQIGSLDRWCEYIIEPLVIFAAVERLNYETCSHSQKHLTQRSATGASRR